MDNDGAHLDKFNAADGADSNARELDDNDANLVWTEECSGGVSAQAEDGEGGYIIEPSTSGTGAQPDAVPIEDGEGGYIIDSSMYSSSPIRSFKKLSDLDPQERAGFDNQFKSKRGRGRRNQIRRPMTSEERRSSTWGRADFDDLFDSGRLVHLF